MNDVWWYLGRSSGIVATALLAAALIWGFAFSGGTTGSRRRPNWWLDLHRYLGGLAFAFVVAHVVFVYQDELSGIGLTQVLVPFTAAGWEWGITFGVVATYVFALVVFTTWPRRIGARRTWLAVHLLSVPAVVLAGTHAWVVGSSRDEWWFQGLLVVLAGAVVYPAVLRTFAAVARRRRTVPSDGSRSLARPVESNPDESAPVDRPLATTGGRR